MEYTYNNNGTIEKVKLERWGWGVVYKPTEAQASAAAAANEQRVAKLREEQEQQVKAAALAGDSADKVEALRAEYEERMQIAGQVETDELQQFGPDGVFHRFAEIEQDRVHMFVMIKTDDPGKRIDVMVPEGAQVFHAYRNFGFGYNTPEYRRARVYMFGWKKTRYEWREGTKYKVEDAAYYYILPDDRLVLASQDTDVSLHDI